MFFVVVFKILVISDDNPKGLKNKLVVQIRNQLHKGWVNGKAHLLKGTEVKPLPETVDPGKINVTLMTY